MEALQRVGDFFTTLSSGFEKGLTKVFGSANERQIRKIGYVRDKEGNASVVPGSVLAKINSLEDEWKQKSDEELLQTAALFRERLANGETLDDLLPEAFAAVRESAWRELQMRHYDVQMVGGYILHQGMIAEMTTGEGKTLVSTLPAFLNALAGSVHVITVNDYLALRDMEWMGPVHMKLGLTVGAIQANMGAEERRKAYACDITYGTNNEFGFDYLRDNMKPSPQLQAQGPLDFAIVDEIDNILIDEARTPLIISGPADDDISKYPKANKIVQQLKRDVHFEVKEKEHTCHLTEDGVRHAEELVGVESFYTAGNMEWPHLLDNALKAHHLYKRDVNYVVQNGEIIIVDEFTGRKMEGRQWSDGLHQAVQSKEGVRIKEENQTLATITLQNFFKLYTKLCGMTGTAMTEAGEFNKIYGLDVVAVPTNRPTQRKSQPDIVYLSEDAKWDAVAEEVAEVHKTGRPVLVGTVSIESSEKISRKLQKLGIEHSVLNAKYQEREAEIIAQAGRKGAVTIATNMAGRGTDIVLGGNPETRAWEVLRQTYASRLDIPKVEWDSTTKQIAEEEGMEAEGKEVAELGGLHVVGTERHDSRRIDLQLRGRAGRQGDPGSSRFFVSLDDTLLRLFAGERMKKVLQGIGGMKPHEGIESRMLTRQLERAQKKREETHFDQRKNLLEYDEVMDDQRKRVYAYRQEVLDRIGIHAKIEEMVNDLLDEHVPPFYDRLYRWDTIASWAGAELHINLDGDSIEDMERDQLLDFLRFEMHEQARRQISEMIEENLPAEGDEREWSWQALSKWCNTHFGINTNVPELKKVGRDDLLDHLADRAGDAIERVDLAPVDVFLDPNYPYLSLCGWLDAQFDMKATPAEFRDFEEAEQAIEHLQHRVRGQLEQKEIELPVKFALSGSNNYLLSEDDRRAELADYASKRFETEITAEQLAGLSKEETYSLLEKASREFHEQGKIRDAMEEQIAKAFPTADSTGADADPQALNDLAAWCRETLKAENVTADDFSELDGTSARDRMRRLYNARFRPEMDHAERTILREILDIAWKEHLYGMDRLRANIGLESYAQKDPKVEYKRQGRKAFEGMWDRIGRETIGTLFRVEIQSEETNQTPYQPTSEIHEAAPEPVGVGAAMESRASGGAEPAPVTEPIRNDAPKVGRNDPCPCGSGKKYKKCCGS